MTSHVDFAKLYVENHMAKFNAFDEHCDASAVLALLGKVPVFPPAVQSAANDVRQARNAWEHCVFSDWDPLSFSQRFGEMKKLVTSMGLPSADEMYLVNELQDWETKGTVHSSCFKLHVLTFTLRTFSRALFLRLPSQQLVSV